MPQLATRILSDASKLSEVATWVIPATAVPVVQYFLDKPEERSSLFIRNFSRYSIGAGMFFMARSATSKLFSHMPSGEQKLASTVASTVFYSVASAAASSKLFNWMKNLAQPEAEVTNQPNAKKLDVLEGPVAATTTFRAIPNQALLEQPVAGFPPAQISVLKPFA